MASSSKIELRAFAPAAAVNISVDNLLRLAEAAGVGRTGRYNPWVFSPCLAAVQDKCSVVLKKLARRWVQHRGVGLQCRDSPLLPRVLMIEPPDRSRCDSTLFPFTSKQLRDFIDPYHLLIQIDERLDFANLVAPLEVGASRTERP